MRPVDLAVDDQHPAFEGAYRKVEMRLAAEYVFNTVVTYIFPKKEWPVEVLRAVARKLSSEGWDVSVVAHDPEYWLFYITCNDPFSFS